MKNVETTKRLRISLAAGVCVLLTACQAHLADRDDPAIRVGDSDLSGVVTSSTGPEAGVWVIAETADLPTKFTKIVVTDDRGRYVMPDLPRASYQVWVRGYGLVDSPKQTSAPGRRLDLSAVVAPGSDPTHTALTEVYEPPFPGYGPRGGDIDRNGVYWASLASGHLGKFDRAKCKALKGPAATGKHCPEGWTLYRFPGPQFNGVQDDGSAEASYYTWGDQFNTLGLGANVPIATGNMSDAYFALVDGKFVTLRVPYPMGFFAKWAEGRIDDPGAGWKGKSLWATSSTRTVFHNEGGTSNRPKVVRFQLRPDPLAR